MPIKRYQLPIEYAEVTNSAVGVYRFTLRFPNNYELGLNDKSPNLTDVRLRLFSVLSDFQKVHAGPPLTGMLENDDVRTHLRRNFSLSASPLSDLPACFGNLLPPEQCDQATLQNVANILRQALDGVIPVYIGMTAKQSFKARLKQHLDGDTNLLPQMRKYQMSISQLWFECMEMENNDASLIRSMEVLAQATVKPPFCKA